MKTKRKSPAANVALGDKVVLATCFDPSWNGLTGVVTEVGPWIQGIGTQLTVGLDSPFRLHSGRIVSKLIVAYSSVVVQ